VIVLAMDISTNTGIALGKPGAAPRTWLEQLGKAPDDRRFSRMLEITSRLIAEHKPDLLVYEAPVGGPKTSHLLVGLIACVRGCAFNRGVRCEAVAIATARKHFLGKHLSTKHFPGKSHAAAKAAIKARVISRCGQLGWQVDGADEADAAALFSYAATTWCGVQAAPLGGLFV